MSNFILGIDFGGAKNAVALATYGLTEWLDYHQQKSSPFATAQSDLDTVLKMGRNLLSSNRGRLLSVGVSFGGPVDFEQGIVKCSYHVTGWGNFASYLWN
ncbi:hypothetical protein ACFLXI_09585 [Chloroflexota bacterium]